MTTIIRKNDRELDSVLFSVLKQKAEEIVLDLSDWEFLKSIDVVRFRCLIELCQKRGVSLMTS